MIDRQIEQLVLLGIPESDREIILHYLVGNDYVAAKDIIDKNFAELRKFRAAEDLQVIQLLKDFVDSKVEFYSHMFQEVPFDVISDHTNSKSYEGEEFG